MKRIMIVEDDRDMSRGLCLALEEKDVRVVPCFDLSSARSLLAGCAPDLVLLDVNLPDGSGLALLREIKAKGGAVPVVLLTADDSEMDVVSGLEHGADDYITKPFSLAVLRARVKAQLRRGAELAPAGAAVDIDGYSFDFERMVFRKSGVPVELSKTEQKLLRLLVENRGTVLSRSFLLDRVWTDGAEYVDENALSVAVKRLRDKLDATRHIRTVYGLGYVWEVNGYERG